MKTLLCLVSMLFTTIALAQTKYYCVKSSDGKSKDLLLAFENGLQIETLGGVPMNGTAQYNTGKGDKIALILEKVETAVDPKGKTGQRYYYYEEYENPASARYIITEWPMGAEIVYISKKKQKYLFYTADTDYSKTCTWGN